MSPRHPVSEPGGRREALLARIAELSLTLSPSLPDVTGAGSSIADLARIVRFSTRSRLRMESEVYERPWLVLVLDGKKHVSAAGHRVVAGPGQALWLPARRSLDITNVPDAGTRTYHALCIELLPEALASWRSRWPRSGLDGALSSGRPVVQDPELAALDAFVQVCESVGDAAIHPLLVQHRLEGLLLALDLQERQADPGPARARTDLLLAVRQLIRSEPPARWRVASVARMLGMSAGTLRRRLAALGSSLRRLLREERMLLARTLLVDGRLGVSEVAGRCGYTSPAKFARQFARTFGMVPSRFRPRLTRETGGSGAGSSAPGASRAPGRRMVGR